MHSQESHAIDERERQAILRFFQMSTRTGKAKDIRFGDRVRLLAGPWTGHEGVYVEDRPGLRGTRRVVLLDNNEEAFAIKPNQWERVLKAA